MDGKVGSVVDVKKLPEVARDCVHPVLNSDPGVLAMARAQQQRQFENGRRPFGIDVLLDEILVVQRAEITKMKAWL